MTNCIPALACSCRSWQFLVSQELHPRSRRSSSHGTAWPFPHPQYTTSNYGGCPSCTQGDSLPHHIHALVRFQNALLSCTKPPDRSRQRLDRHNLNRRVVYLALVTDVVVRQPGGIGGRGRNGRRVGDSGTTWGEARQKKGLVSTFHDLNGVLCR